MTMHEINPIISIILPVYGVEQFVGQCIESIMSQDYDNIELIIVDDCTPDNSIDVINRTLIALGKNIQTRYIKHENNRGISATRNTGVRAAQGHYILFIDSDDCLLPGAVSALVRGLGTSDVDIVEANNKILNWNTKEAFNRCELIKKQELIETFPQLLKAPVIGTVWNKLIKKDFFIKNNLWFREGLVFEDDLWTFQVMCAKPKIQRITDETYIYYIRDNSILTTYTSHHMESRIRLFIESVKIYDSLQHDVRAYGAYKIELFRQGALTAMLNATADSKSYNRLYKLLRKIRTPIYNIFVGSNKSMGALLFVLLLLIPVPLAMAINKKLSAHIISHTPYSQYGKYIKTLSLDESFWDKLALYIS